MKKEVFWSYTLLLIAYMLPVIIGLAMTKYMYILWGALPMAFNMIIVHVMEQDRQNSEILQNAVLVFILGILSTVAIIVTASAWAVWMTVAMFVVSLIISGVL